ncbi:MAG: hypothetical protein K2J20_03485, partial [Bacilli bacterium]|nr:hypothetical protein [Bacilli bacterium]
MSKRYKIWLSAIFIMIIIVVSVGVFKAFFKKEPDNTPKNATSIISNITEYGYTLDDRDTKYMKEVYKELENILKESEIDYEEYARVLAKLFVIDFYTLSNKINKYDVGSLEYILSSSVSSFKSKAMDTIYNDIIDNTYKDRIQELPEITNVEILKFEEDTIEIEEKETDCYKVSMKYKYRKDLGYDTSGTVYLVRNN